MPAERPPLSGADIRPTFPLQPRRRHGTGSQNLFHAQTSEDARIESKGISHRRGHTTQSKVRITATPLHLSQPSPASRCHAFIHNCAWPSHSNSPSVVDGGRWKMHPSPTILHARESLDKALSSHATSSPADRFLFYLLDDIRFGSRTPAS
jgi:hypothetical protein